MNIIPDLQRTAVAVFIVNQTKLASQVHSSGICLILDQIFLSFNMITHKGQQSYLSSQSWVSLKCSAFNNTNFITQWLLDTDQVTQYQIVTRICLNMMTMHTRQLAAQSSVFRKMCVQNVLMFCAIISQALFLR